jgi:hypothetical protein
MSILVLGLTFSGQNASLQRNHISRAISTIRVSANLCMSRRSEKTATNIRVHLDAFVGEERGKAHLVSVAGGDTEIGALAAAFANGDLFTVIDPVGKESLVSLGDRPLCFRGSILIPGRKRPLRHLVSCSQELADAQCDGKLLLVSDNEMSGKAFQGKID